jgi:hypothetical protein
MSCCNKRNILYATKDSGFDLYFRHERYDISKEENLGDLRSRNIGSTMMKYIDEVAGYGKVDLITLSD